MNRRRAFELIAYALCLGMLMPFAGASATDEPTREETEKWLKQKLKQTSRISSGPKDNSYSKLECWEIKAIREGELSIESTAVFTYPSKTRSVEVRESTIPIRECTVTVFKEENQNTKEENKGGRGYPYYQVLIATKGAAAVGKYKGKSTQYNSDGETEYSGEMEGANWWAACCFPDKETAERVAKAFRHLIKLYGEEKEPF